MILLLARHGNTFEKGEVPRIVGAYEDLPLTAEGRQQAQVLGRALAETGLDLRSILAGPLQRTAEFARLAASTAGHASDITIDQRLREIDFGSWSGLSDEEIARSFGQPAIEAWRRDGVRPENCGWAPDEDTVRSGLKALVADMRENTLCVTSNGILRYAMELDPQAFGLLGSDGGFRVRTGNICAFRRTATGLKLLFWDKRPESTLLRAL